MEFKLDEYDAELAELLVMLRPCAVDDAELLRLIRALGSGSIDDDDLAALIHTFEPGI